ncbi:MAG: hypothetical protein IJR59_07670 [Firmicutes bacterium]|nr:hypothetical protein [Bacillota bacterium]
MKKIYNSPELKITKFVSQTATNVVVLSGIQSKYKTNSAKKIGGGNLIDF